MNTRLPLVLTFALFSSVVAAACGGGQPDAHAPVTTSTAPVASSPPPVVEAPPPPPATTPAAVTPPPPATPPPTPKVWKEATTKDQQMAFMKANIAPRMGKVFQAQDAKKYADFGCITCHGPKYLPPKEFLPHLAMKKGKFAGKPETIKFMMEKVVPEMASAMGEPPWDPATKQGFGCGSCHMIDMK